MVEVGQFSLLLSYAIAQESAINPSVEWKKNEYVSRDIF